MPNREVTAHSSESRLQHPFGGPFCVFFFFFFFFFFSTKQTNKYNAKTWTEMEAETDMRATSSSVGLRRRVSVCDVCASSAQWRRVGLPPRMTRWPCRKQCMCIWPSNVIWVTNTSPRPNDFASLVFSLGTLSGEFWSALSTDLLWSSCKQNYWHWGTGR